MINEKIQAALNNQLNDEFYSSYLYLSMSSYFEEENLNGFSSWMRLQSQEEYLHAMKVYDYIHQIGGKVTLKDIKAPSTKWNSIIQVFEETAKHESEVTKSINKLVELTINEKDFATNNFLQWFITEQVEEEATSQKILEKVKMIGDNKSALYLLDQELGKRVTSTN